MSGYADPLGRIPMGHLPITPSASSQPLSATLPPPPKLPQHEQYQHQQHQQQQRHHHGDTTFRPSTITEKPMFPDASFGSDLGSECSRMPQPAPPPLPRAPSPPPPIMSHTSLPMSSPQPHLPNLPPRPRGPTQPASDSTIPPSPMQIYNMDRQHRSSDRSPSSQSYNSISKHSSSSGSSRDPYNSHNPQPYLDRREPYDSYNSRDLHSNEREYHHDRSERSDRDVRDMPPPTHHPRSAPSPPRQHASHPAHLPPTPQRSYDRTPERNGRENHNSLHYSQSHSYERETHHSYPPPSRNSSHRDARDTRDNRDAVSYPPRERMDRENRDERVTHHPPRTDDRNDYDRSNRSDWDRYNARNNSAVNDTPRSVPHYPSDRDRPPPQPQAPLSDRNYDRSRRRDQDDYRQHNHSNDFGNRYNDSRDAHPRDNHPRGNDHHYADRSSDRFWTEERERSERPERSERYDGYGGTKTNNDHGYRNDNNYRDYNDRRWDDDRNDRDAYRSFHGHGGNNRDAGRNSTERDVRDVRYDADHHNHRGPPPSSRGNAYYEDRDGRGGQTRERDHGDGRVRPNSNYPQHYERDYPQEHDRHHHHGGRPQMDYPAAPPLSPLSNPSFSVNQEEYPTTSYNRYRDDRREEGRSSPESNFACAGSSGHHRAQQSSLHTIDSSMENRTPEDYRKGNSSSRQHERHSYTKNDERRNPYYDDRDGYKSGGNHSYPMGPAYESGYPNEKTYKETYESSGHYPVSNSKRHVPTQVAVPVEYQEQRDDYDNGSRSSLHSHSSTTTSAVRQMPSYEQQAQPHQYRPQSHQEKPQLHIEIPVSPNVAPHGRQQHSQPNTNRSSMSRNVATPHTQNSNYSTSMGSNEENRPHNHYRLGHPQHATPPPPPPNPPPPNQNTKHSLPPKSPRVPTSSSAATAAESAEAERKKSEARHQILKEIRQATNMRNSALDDNDRRFWERQISTLNESFKKL